MNDVQFEVVQTYLNEIKDFLGLKDWIIELDRTEPKSDNSWAEVTVCDAHDTAWVRIAYPSFFEQKPEDQRQWLIHEVMHCHFDRIQEVMRKLEKHTENSSAMEFAKDQHMTEIEFSTDRIARVLAPFFPLPKFPHLIPEAS